MDEVWLLYWFTRLDAVNGMGVMFAVVGAFATFATIVFGSLDGASSTLRTVRRLTIPVTILGLLIITFVPTQRDMAIIVGGTMAIKAAKTPEASALGSELYNAVMEQLKRAANPPEERRR
jgi:hypothetical protein